MTSVAVENGGTDSYEYDANGNMTCRIENGVVYTHTYNAENRASSIAKRNTDCTGTIIESWSFAYDGDGMRVMTAHFTGTNGTPDSTTAYFMGGQYELKDGAVKKYYSIAGMMVAVNDGTGLQYLLTDHLGSTVAVTNSSGTLTSQQRYLPFGAARIIPNSPILGTDFGYTGQRLLDSGMGGIMDYKARFFSPYLNHFTQPDSIVSNPYNPQDWNRYAYARNNPIKYTDPTGHTVVDDDDGGLTLAGYSYVVEKRFAWNLEGDWSFEEVKTIYQTGHDIEEYVDGLTDGKGQEWMNEYLGGTNIVHSPSYFPQDRNLTLPGWISGGTNTINLFPGWLSQDGGSRWLVHEMGHVWDMNTAWGVSINGAHGGVGDDLNTFVGGHVADSIFNSRYWDESGANAIPNDAQYSYGYANNSTADYLAETFAFQIYPDWNPGGNTGAYYSAPSWVQAFIILQSYELP
ncbi:MAG: RHS repeat-associated core domain-containing protein [Anaerolineales bacterium]|nr:RHS repeat-associated core domain-containing protein [Anaerolineales bacterium]